MNFKTPVNYLIENNLRYEKELMEDIKKKEVYLAALKEQTLGYVKKLDCGIYFNGETMWKAWRYFSLKKKKKSELTEDDKEKLNAYKSSYTFIESRIGWEFIPDKYKFKITDFIMVGMDEYGYKITFDIWKENAKSSKREFNIQIPIVANINSKNIDYALYGEYRLGHQNGMCDEFIMSSYCEDNIKNRLLELMERGAANEI